MNRTKIAHYILEHLPFRIAVDSSIIEIVLTDISPDIPGHTP